MALGPQFEEFEQLQMLMTGKELQSRITDSNDRRYVYGRKKSKKGDSLETMPELWSRKAEESKQPAQSGHGSGVFDSLAEHGLYPDTMIGLLHLTNRTVVNDGHHRIAAAAELEDEGKQVFFPVEHRTY